MEIFLRGAGVPDDADINSIENYDCFSGLRSVIRHRLDQWSLDQVKAAAELFNWTVDFGLSNCDERATAVVEIGTVEKMAPLLLNRILDELPDDSGENSQVERGILSGIGGRFLPFAPVLRIPNDTVSSAGWIQNQLALRLFFWTAEIYKAELQNEIG